MTVVENIFKEALILKPSVKVQLVDELLNSLDRPDKEIDKFWAKEAEDRIDAYDQGEIRSVSLDEVLKKYN